MTGSDSMDLLIDQIRQTRYPNKIVATRDPAAFAVGSLVATLGIPPMSNLIASRLFRPQERPVGHGDQRL